MFESIVELEQQWPPPENEDGYDNADAPSFGTSSSSEEDVKHFYAFWSNFLSGMPFAFAEQHRLSEVGRAARLGVRAHASAALRARATADARRRAGR